MCHIYFFFDVLCRFRICQMSAEFFKKSINMAIGILVEKAGEFSSSQ